MENTTYQRIAPWTIASRVERSVAPVAKPRAMAHVCPTPGLVGRDAATDVVGIDERDFFPGVRAWRPPES